MQWKYFMKRNKERFEGLPAISIFVSRKVFEAGITELLFWFDVATVVEARLAEVETMFSTISALFCCVLLLVVVVLVLEASKASEVTTTAAAGGTVEATAIEATVLEAAAVVNTVTAGATASGTAVAVVAHAAAATATEAAEAGWGCFLEDEGLLDPPHEEAVEELLDSVEAAAAVEHNVSFLWISVRFCKGGFFSESAMRFLDLQISKKNIPKSYPELEI